MKFEYNLPDLKKEKRYSITASITTNSKQRGIYALFYQNKLIYVGQTINLGFRLATHRRKYGYELEYALYKLPDASVKELLIYEAIYISHYNPTINLQAQIYNK